MARLSKMARLSMLVKTSYITCKFKTVKVLHIADLNLKQLFIAKAATFYMRKGQPVVVPNGPQSGMVRIADAGGCFLGVGLVREDGKLAPVRLLSQ